MERAKEEWALVWGWRKWRPYRYGQAVRIVAEGNMGSVLVQFEDGELVRTQKWAVRPKKAEGPTLFG